MGYSGVKISTKKNKQWFNCSGKGILLWVAKNMTLTQQVKGAVIKNKETDVSAGLWQGFVQDKCWLFTLLHGEISGSGGFGHSNFDPLQFQYLCFDSFTLDINFILFYVKD